MCCKKRNVCYGWIPATCNCENIQYLASTLDDSAVMCDKTIESYDEETNTVPTNFNEKKTTWKT